MNNYFLNERPDIIKFLKPYITKQVNVLEVGCASGGMGTLLRQAFSVNQLTGIEINENITPVSRDIYNEIIIGDIVELLRSDKIHGKYDLITFADVLEHLVDPWLALQLIRHRLENKGIIVASIPNLAYEGVVRKIIFDKWIYTSEGSLDKTHLRFFTKRTILQMFDSAGYDIIKVEAETYPGIKKKIFNMLTLGKMKGLLAGKYLIVARAKNMQDHL